MSDRRQRILEEWNTYRKMVVPPNATDDQLLQLRRAFFGGASMAYSLMVNESVEPEHGLEVLNDMDAEFRDFAERSKTGAV